VAVKAVAALHCQAKSFTTPRPQGLTGWQRRVRQLSSIMLSPRVLPKKSNRPEPSNAEVRALCEQFDKVLRSPDVVRALTRMIAHRMPTMQVPVLQDCWWGHIFFSETQQRITGIIDLDSASRDDPAVDMARLLGSWQIENALCSEKLIDLWPEAFEIYKQTYRCNPDFSRRVQRLHDTAIVCGLDRWFSWILIENRQFLNMPWVMERIRRLFLATPHALRRLGAH
ncbi:phosphotransferase, partial [Pirellulales bacterium]|nr:phosphotransferase [Pirellulales bacterium]